MEWLDNRRGGGLQVGRHSALASEGPRSTGLEADCEGRRQGPRWTVAP